MKHARPLPDYLVHRYQGWKATTFEQDRNWYKRLVEDGQHPRCMVIACCDSRVNVISVFGADQGELFIHRNIANLVPPHDADGHHHGTSAAIEYAVNTLKISHLIVLGHSQCGGVKGCYDMCSGHAPELEEHGNFVGRWMSILRPGFESLDDGDDATRVTQLEKQSVVVSLNNLMTFPNVKDAVESGVLSVHGLWLNIAEGQLEAYDPETGSYGAI